VRGAYDDGARVSGTYALHHALAPYTHPIENVAEEAGVELFTDEFEVDLAFLHQINRI
jgi:hypothetical protein